MFRQSSAKSRFFYLHITITKLHHKTIKTVLTTDYDPGLFLSGRHSHDESSYRSNQMAFSILTLKFPFVITVNQIIANQVDQIN